VSNPARSAAQRLPGGRVRKIVATIVPRRLKVALRRRFHGTRLFPAPPPRPRPPAAGPAVSRATRVVTLELPALAALTARPPLVIEAPPTLFIPKKLAATGLAGYEPEAMACFLALLQSAGAGAVIDVGANVGLYALLAGAGSGRDVRAFEPTPELAAVARNAARRNGLDVVVEELALGRERGRATLFLSDRTDSSNSLAAGFRPSSRQIEISVETLDAYCARTGVAPAIIKVDTETTEPDVLAGAAATIARHRPWIICEVLHGRRPGELAEVMAPHGYTWYHLRGEAEPQPVETLTGDPGHTHLMYVLAPRRVDARLWTRTAAWRAALERTARTQVGTPASSPAQAARVPAAAAALVTLPSARVGTDVPTDLPTDVTTDVTTGTGPTPGERPSGRADDALVGVSPPGELTAGRP
jgi:FkbM family methyltransferase